MSLGCCGMEITDHVPWALPTLAQPRSATPTIRRRTNAPLRFVSRTMAISLSAPGLRREHPSEALRASGSGRIHQHPVVAGVRHVEDARAIHGEARGVGDLTGRCAGGSDHRPVALGIALLDPTR